MEDAVPRIAFSQGQDGLLDIPFVRQGVHIEGVPEFFFKTRPLNLEGKQLLKGLDCAIASQSRCLEMKVLLRGIQHEIGKTEQLLELLRRSVVGDLLLAQENNQVGVGGRKLARRLNQLLMQDAKLTERAQFCAQAPRDSLQALQIVSP